MASFSYSCISSPPPAYTSRDTSPEAVSPRSHSGTRITQPSTNPTNKTPYRSESEVRAQLATEGIGAASSVEVQEMTFLNEYRFQLRLEILKAQEERARSSTHADLPTCPPEYAMAGQRRLSIHPVDVELAELGQRENERQRSGPCDVLTVVFEVALLVLLGLLLLMLLGVVVWSLTLVKDALSDV